jgi:hypothetical protein
MRNYVPHQPFKGEGSAKPGSMEGGRGRLEKLLKSGGQP